MLAKTPRGNLGAVWAEISAKEDMMNRIVERQAPTDAEVSNDKAPDWYLVRTLPGDDARAMRYLARRRFGVFRPMQQRTDKHTGKKVAGWEQVFPGWIFVFCWDIDKMRARILSTPGVMGILCHRVSQRPVPVNEPDKDGVHFIDKLRALSWVYEENVPHARHYSTMRAMRNEARIKPRRTKIDKRTRKTLQKLKNSLRAQGRWDSSTWESANELAPHERIALLQRALNAPSLAA